MLLFVTCFSSPEIYAESPKGIGAARLRRTLINIGPPGDLEIDETGGNHSSF